MKIYDDTTNREDLTDIIKGIKMTSTPMGPNVLASPFKSTASYVAPHQWTRQYPGDAEPAKPTEPTLKDHLKGLLDG